MFDFELNSEQEEEMLKFWNDKVKENLPPPSIKDITDHLFPNQNLDGRSQEGRAIKKCLSRHNLKAKTSTDYEKIHFPLSDEQKLFIDNHYKNSTIIDMARTLFKNPVLNALNVETRRIAEYIRDSNKDVFYKQAEEIEEIPDTDYEPPESLFKTVRRANLYLNNMFDKDRLTPIQKRGIEALINYLHTYRFIKQINIYDSQTDRRSFEDAFIRYTYDKPDLSQEEIDQYIVLANEVVLAFKAQKRSEKLQNMLDQLTDNGPESAKIAMSLVEAIGKAQIELNSSIKRQGDLLDDLKEKRSAKLSKKMQENATILNVLEEWKNEETRKNWMRLAEIEQRKVKEELEHIESMSDIKARLLGFSKEEILNS